MSLIIDVVILAIIALFTFIGYKQGLVKSALKILTFFIAIAVAVILYKVVANLVVSNTTIDENIKAAIVDKILPDQMGDTDITHEKFSISTSIIDTANSTIEEISQSFAIKIIEVCTFLILFVVVKIILKFVTVLSSLITKLPIINQLDKTGGTIYGLIKGLFIVWCILGIASLISPLLQPEFLNIINESMIARVLYKYNLLLIFLF